MSTLIVTSTNHELVTRQTLVSSTGNALATFRENHTSIKSHTFAEMVKLAAPVLKAYHGDLFHDAMSLNEMIDKGAQAGVSFSWSVSETGTCMSERIEDVVSREHVYKIIVFPNMSYDRFSTKWIVEVYHVVGITTRTVA